MSRRVNTHGSDGHTSDDSFIAALRANREDDDMRQVYADWLEARGEIVRAELLRLAAKRTLSKTDRKRRSELAATTSNAWRRAVSRPLDKADGETLMFPAAVQRIARSDHPAAKQISAKVEEWVESFQPDKDDEDDPYAKVIVYDGDLSIAKGDLETSASAVAVLGDLVVENQFTDLIESDQSLLAVAGDLTCRAIWQLGDGLVCGNVRCNVLYGSSYNANRTEILGNVVASEAIIENGHHIVIHGTLHTVVRLGRKIRIAGVYFDDDGSEDALDPALVDEDGWNEGELYKRICKGASILKPAARGTAPTRCVPPKAKPKKRAPAKRARTKRRAGS